MVRGAGRGGRAWVWSGREWRRGTRAARTRARALGGTRTRGGVNGDCSTRLPGRPSQPSTTHTHTF
eukprot:2658350-Rhodomonas_salina.1